MTSPTHNYELVYHAGIPGRGEFVRLLFEATGTVYRDSASIEPYMDGSFPGHGPNPLPFAPPILRHGDVVVSQTPAILLYLATHLDAPIDLSSESRDSAEPQAPPRSSRPTPTLQDASIYHVHALVLTILDLSNETHDTHHPISVSSYYEDQQGPAALKAADFRQHRVPKFFKYFEAVLDHTGGWLVLADTPSYADLCLFQVVDGLKFAFPNLMKNLLPSHPKVQAHYDRVKSAHRIKSYLESDRRQRYSVGVFRYYEELDEPK